MELRYDDDFVEASVFFAFSGKRPGTPVAKKRRFNLERERCYNTLDPDDRQAAFATLYHEWFRECGFEQVLLGALSQYPLLSNCLDVLAFRSARSKKEEAAELYVSPENQRSAVVAMRPERFTRDEETPDFLRREFAHLNDMLDPGFGYDPVVPSRGFSRRAATDRYRLLWDITIDGRLGASDRRDRHRALFDQAFHFWPETRREQVFRELWTGRAPRHQRLIGLACDPRDLAHADLPLPGGSCPLCGFATFDWMDVAQLAPEGLKAIENDFPNWSPSQGMCSRCAEVYAVLQEYV